MFTRSHAEIENTLNVHPLTRVTYPRTLKDNVFSVLEMCLL